MEISCFSHRPFCREFFHHAAAWLLLAALSGPAGIAAEPARDFTAALTGSVAGTVSNAGTGNLLEGAHVELPTLGIVALADRIGRFMLNGIPAGTHAQRAKLGARDDQIGLQHSQ